MTTTWLIFCRPFVWACRIARLPNASVAARTATARTGINRARIRQCSQAQVRRSANRALIVVAGEYGLEWLAGDDRRIVRVRESDGPIGGHFVGAAGARGAA